MTEEFITTRQAAKRYGVCTQRIIALLTQHRIPGAKKHGPVWMIPADFVVSGSPKRRRGMKKIRPVYGAAAPPSAQKK